MQSVSLIWTGWACVKLVNFGLVLGSSRFFQLHLLPQKMTLSLEVVKSDSEIIISIFKSTSMKHSVEHFALKNAVFVQIPQMF